MLIEHRRAGVSLEDIYLSIELRPEVEMRFAAHEHPGRDYRP